jgi:RNA polymerase sigma-70 factor, ECF subfamily
MDETPPSDRSLLRRVRVGSEGAAGELHRRYADRLLALARAKTGTDLKARVDAEDIVQSVFGSFFRGAKRGLYSAPDGEELWGLFLVIALNKIRAQGTRHRAAKRDVRRTSNEAGTETNRYGVPADDRSAYELLRIVVDELLDDRPESVREIVRLRIENHEVAEIAGRTGRSKRTVERVLQEFRSQLAEELKPAEDDGHDPVA